MSAAGAVNAGILERRVCALWVAAAGGAKRAPGRSRDAILLAQILALSPALPVLGNGGLRPRAAGGGARTLSLRQAIESRAAPVSSVRAAPGGVARACRRRNTHTKNEANFFRAGVVGGLDHSPCRRRQQHLSRGLGRTAGNPRRRVGGGGCRQARGALRPAAGSREGICLAVESWLATRQLQRLCRVTQIEFRACAPEVGGGCAAGGAEQAPCQGHGQHADGWGMRAPPGSHSALVQPPINPPMR